ncbi:hypothetical protein [Legionella sp.]|uniref:hypothetical protein n=1 Tax=Legionella sp. TaxID=459 RepID=UPI003CB82FD2
MNIEISLRSYELINEYKLSCTHGLSEKFTSLDLESLLVLLNNLLVSSPGEPTKLSKKIAFIRMSLGTELLHDLAMSMIGKEPAKNIEDNTSGDNKLKFIVLFFSGSLIAACGAFDGIVTIMSTFSVPTVVIFASGFIFSFFSVVAFCCLDLVKLASILGVKLNDAHKVLNLYSCQLEAVKLIRKKIAHDDFSHFSINKLNQLVLIINMLQKRFTQLNEANIQFDQVFNSIQMQIAKWVVFGVSGAMISVGGFCSGQTVSLFVLGIFTPTVTAVSLPVIVFSLVVGLAALSLYWGIEYPELKTYISGWLGLNEEKIATLCDKTLLDKEEEKLASLQKQIEGVVQLKDLLSKREQTAQASEKQADNTVLEVSNKPAVTKLGETIHSFMGPKPTRGAIRDASRDETTARLI